MRVAARVFLVIGLLCSIIILSIGLTSIGWSTTNDGEGAGMTIFFVVYGLYALITSIGSLVSLSKTSKKAVIIWGILYMPVVLLASIFMFCVREEDM